MLSVVDPTAYFSMTALNCAFSDGSFVHVKSSCADLNCWRTVINVVIGLRVDFGCFGHVLKINVTRAVSGVKKSAKTSIAKKRVAIMSSHFVVIIAHPMRNNSCDVTVIAFF